MARSLLFDRHGKFDDLAVNLNVIASTLVTEATTWHQITTGTVTQVRNTLETTVDYTYSPYPTDRLDFVLLNGDFWGTSKGSIYFDGPVLGDKNYYIFDVADHRLKYRIVTAEGDDLYSESYQDYDTKVEYDYMHGKIAIPGSSEKADVELIVAEDADAVRVGTINFTPPPRTDSLSLAGNGRDELHGKVALGSNVLNVHEDVGTSWSSSNSDTGYSGNAESVHLLGETWNVGSDRYEFRNATIYQGRSSDGYNSWFRQEVEGEVWVNGKKVGTLQKDPPQADGEDGRVNFTVNGKRVLMFYLKGDPTP